MEPRVPDPRCRAGLGDSFLLTPLAPGSPVLVLWSSTAPSRNGGAREQTQHKDRFLSPAFILADSVVSFTFIQGTQWQGEYKMNSKKGVGVRGQRGGSSGFSSSSSSSSSVSSSSVPPTSWPAPWLGSPR